MKYDVAIIGGGPAGIMAAGRAGELGARVVLIEKNSRLGIKLLSSGGTRCNITNVSSEPRAMTVKYGKLGKFLISSLHRFSAEAVIEFFERRGVKVKTEKGGRVFPQSDRATDVLEALLKYIKHYDIDIKTGVGVNKFVIENNKILAAVLLNGEKIEAKVFIIATGGKSYPATGSVGDGYVWLKNMGHSISALLPALTPVVLKEKFVAELTGLSLHDVEISAYKNGKLIDKRFGDAIFTGSGMSGPAVHDLSKAIGTALPAEVYLGIDFFPGFEQFKFDHRLQTIFQENNNKQFKNIIATLLPPKVVPVITKLSGIDPEKRINQISREERLRLVGLLKDLRFTVVGVGGFDKAIITAGGVSLSEINPKTMHSLLAENLFLAGEILDLDGPTGGYNLQICWSTGYVAGENAAKEAKEIYE